MAKLPATVLLAMEATKTMSMKSQWGIPIPLLLTLAKWGFARETASNTNSSSQGRSGLYGPSTTMTNTKG